MTLSQHRSTVRITIAAPVPPVNPDASMISATTLDGAAALTDLLFTEQNTVSHPMVVSNNGDLNPVPTDFCGVGRRPPERRRPAEPAEFCQLRISGRGLRLGRTKSRGSKSL
jgi:hypothetical protein